MKTLGIIGGMGPMATAYLLELIIQMTAAKTDQEHLSAVVLNNPQVPDRTAYILDREKPSPLPVLEGMAHALENLGCGVLCAPCVTSHYFYEELAGCVRVPFLHMVRETVKVLSADPGVHKVGILATDGTVRTGVYQRECEAQGLTAFSPPPEVQKVVMSIIYDEIKKGEKGSREKFAVMDRCLRAAGCDAAILGCTELSVFRTYHPLPEFYVDAMDILAERCITYCGYKLRMV